MTELAPTCNLCGLSCVLGKEEDPCHGPHGLINAKVSGGYESTPGNGSGALDDGVRYRFSLCEFCLDWLFSQFKVPVAVDDYMNDCVLRSEETIEEAAERTGGFVRLSRSPEPEPWKPAAQRVAEDDWRMMKDEFFKEATRRSAARKG